MYNEYPILAQKLQALHLRDYLEFGCGGGGFLEFILKQNATWTSIIAVDINAESVKKARSLLEGFAIKFIVTEILPLDLDSRSFDTITLSNTIHHLKDKESVFSELKRLLRPGGQVIITEMVDDDLSKAEEAYYRFHSLRAAVDTLKGIYHESTYPAAWIQNLLVEAGLTIRHHDRINNSKVAVPLQEEIIEIETILDDTIRDWKDEHPDLIIEADHIKSMIREYGIKRPPQVYIEAGVE